MKIGPVELSCPEGAVTLAFEGYEEAGDATGGVLDPEGDFARGTLVTAARREMKTLEALARKAGCAEMRVAGRNWARVLNDYQPLPGGKPNRLRKRLT